MNPYAIAAIVIALIGSHWWMYHQGQQGEIVKAEHAALLYREKEIGLIAQIEEAKTKREVIYRDKIHAIQGAVDPTACLDTPFPAEFLHAIRSPQAKPKPNG